MKESADSIQSTADMSK